MGGIVCRVRYISNARNTESICLFEEWSFLEFLTDYNSWGRKIPKYLNIGGLCLLFMLSIFNKVQDFVQSYIVSILLVGFLHCLAPFENEERYFPQELSIFDTLLAKILYINSSCLILMGVMRDCRRTDFTSFFNCTPRSPFIFCYGICFIGSHQDNAAYFYYGLGFAILFGLFYLLLTTFCFEYQSISSSSSRSRLVWSLIFCISLFGILHFFTEEIYSHAYGQYFRGSHWRLFNVIARSFWAEFSLLVILFLPTYRELLIFCRKKETITDCVIPITSEKMIRNQKKNDDGEQKPIFSPVFQPNLTVPIPGMYRCSSQPSLFTPQQLTSNTSMPMLNTIQSSHPPSYDANVYFSKN